MNIRFHICALLSVVQSASASELLVASSSGRLVAGENTELELYVWESDNADGIEESNSIVGVEIGDLGPVSFDFDGDKALWVTEFRPSVPGDVQLVVTTTDGTTLETLLNVDPPFTEEFSSVIDIGTSRGESIDVSVPSACGESVSYGSSEGLWSSESGELSWSSDTNRHPRLALIGVANHGPTCTEVIWTSVRLSSLVPVTVSTEPGSTMVVEIGGRSYGPVVADSEGAAMVNLRVRPGELNATASLMDPLGNSQETTIPTGGRPVPAMAIVTTGELRVGEPPPDLHIGAVSGRGGPYSGSSVPRCLSGNGRELQLRQVSQGIWRTSLPDTALEGGFDYRVDCQLESVHAAHRIPVVRGEPSRIRLRVYPTELSADFPVAEVEASLLDAYGDRISAAGLFLSTEHGEILEEPHAEVLRGDFVGEPGMQEDSIIAGWRMPVVAGPLRNIEIGTKRVDFGVEVVVRALSSGSTVLAGQTLTVSVGDQSNEIVTNSGGWATTAFHGLPDPFVVRVTGGGIFRESIVVPSSERWLDSSAPDLVSETPLSIRNGNIRTIGVNASPSVLFGGSGQNSQIVIRLLDRSGNLLESNDLVLVATSGEVQMLGQNDVGEYHARYTPDQQMLLGEVDITASTEEFSTSFGITVVPRPQNSTLAASMGWMLPSDSANGRLIGVDFDQRLELLGGAAMFRASYLNWTINSELFDSVRESTLSVEMQVNLLSGNMMLLRENGLVSTWFGGGVALAPYRQTLTFEGEVPVTGWGISQFGTMGIAGVGRRALGGQLFFEGRWIGLRDGGGSVAYGDSIGGVAALVGFRLIL